VKGLRILTIERDDLLTKVTSLDRELNKVKKEKQKLEEVGDSNEVIFCFRCHDFELQGPGSQSGSDYV